MLYPKIRKLGDVITYAVEKGFDNIVILGENEVRDGIFTVKTLATKEQKTVTYDELVEFLNN